MALSTLAVVILRYAFDQGAIVLQESVTYLHGVVFMLGIPYALKDNAHVRVDLFYSRWSPRTQTAINLTGHLVFLVPVSLFILIYSWDYVAASWRIREGSPEVGGIPAVYLLKSLLPLMSAMLLLQGLGEALDYASKLRNDSPRGRKMAPRS
ncbi:MAG: TRAP transporter small permease subunit [Anaerolineae bacterium]|nr:TRAP transporter small permease subunit [Anaerolineae bacterium]